MIHREDHLDSARRASVLADLDEAAVPLARNEPEAPLTDLAPIGRAVADADVIGLGEGSHGTRDFFEFKHRLVRYLVEEQDLRLLALEANVAATLDVNDYVVSGDGSVTELLSRETVHGPYRVEALRELLEWAREFNEGRPRDDRVRIHGLDVQHADAPAEKLRDYVEAVDPSALDGLRDDLATLSEHGWPDVSDEAALEAHVDARARVVDALEAELDEREADYVDATGRREHSLAERLVWTLDRGREQFAAIHQGRTDSGANVRIRDSAMAAQALWLRRHESADRIALWGHNAHLASASFAGGRNRHRQEVPSLGSNLAGVNGLDYYALGTLLGGGTVRAAYVPESEFREYEIESPPDGSIPEVFAEGAETPFFLPLTALDADGDLATWLDARPTSFDVQGGYRDSPVNRVRTDLRRQFDGVVFFADTEPTRSLPPGDAG